MSGEHFPTPARAAIAVLMAGNILLSACGERAEWENPHPSVSAPAEPTPSPSPSPSRAAPQDPAEACRNLIAEGAQIEPWACEPLPQIKEGDYTSVSSPMRNVTFCKGYGVLAGYVGGPRKTNLTGLPAPHAEAITKTMQNPLTAQLMGYSEGGTYFNVALDIKDMDAFYTEVKRAELSNTKQDISEICFRSESTLPIGLHATLNHEGGHALYSQLEELAAGDGEKANAIRDELSNLKDLCKQEFGLVVETFRTAQQQQAQEALTKLRAVFAEKNNTAYVKAVDELRQRFATENGLNELLISNEPQMGLYLDRELLYLVDLVRDKQGNPNKENIHSQLTILEYRDWSALADRYEDYIAEQFGYMLEGMILEGAVERGYGHADTPTGNFASGIASTQVHPKNVARRMNALPLAQRRVAVQKFGSMQRLIHLLDPKLAEQTHLTSVASTVNIAG